MKRGFLSLDWQSVVFDGRNDVVFDGRNNEYGAYEIRRDYSRFLTKALIIAATSIILLISIPLIVNLISGYTAANVKPVDVIIDMAPPPIDKAEPPPSPPPPPPPPVMETIKFTVPVVVEEKIDEIPPPQEKLTETHVAEETHEGDPDALVVADTKNEVIEDNTVYDLVAIQEQPGFPGGDGELFKFLQKNIQFPQVEKENGIQGKVFITFVVDKDGSVVNVEVYKGLKGGPGCDKEALRVVKMMPKWSPGKQNGKSVKVRYILPIHFKLA